MEPTTEQAYQRRIAELEAEVAELRAQAARLSGQTAKLSKNSSNSSKPPCSDIVKRPKPASSKKTKRKIGGQPGHAKHERELFSSNNLDDVREYELNCCPDCGGSLSSRPREMRVVQQVELAERAVQIIQHRDATVMATPDRLITVVDQASYTSSLDARKIKPHTAIREPISPPGRDSNLPPSAGLASWVLRPTTVNTKTPPGPTAADPKPRAPVSPVR